MNLQTLWQASRLRFGHTSPAPLPNYLVIDRTSLREIGNSQRDVRSHLVRGGVPKPGLGFIKVGNSYVGVITLEDTPGGWESYRQQMFELPNLFMTDGIHNVEIFTEFSPVDAVITRTQLQRSARQSQTTIERSDADEVVASHKHQ